jgi:divalent metal cation (Fe/Co/Zn/Cd) transporter
LRPAFDEIMDATPSVDLESSVRKIAMTVEGVVGLDKCYVRKMGLAYYVDLHVVVDGSISVQLGHGIAHMVKDKVKLLNPTVMDVFIHVEPADV